MRLRSLWLAIALLAACGSPFPGLAKAYESHYIATTDLPPLLLPPPPAEGSDEWKKNVQAVLAAQKNLKDKHVNEIRDEQGMRLGLMTEVIGAGFTRDKYPRAYKLLDYVADDSNQITENDKRFWHTRRPYLTDPKVNLLVDKLDKSPSYPSGHSSGGHILAEVLGLLFPDRLADLRAKADSIAQHRIQAGAHYPVDIEGGRTLSMLMLGAYMKDEEFQSDLAAARKEVGRDLLANP